MLPPHPFQLLMPSGGAANPHPFRGIFQYNSKNKVLFWTNRRQHWDSQIDWFCSPCLPTAVAQHHLFRGIFFITSNNKTLYWTDRSQDGVTLLVSCFCHSKSWTTQVLYLIWFVNETWVFLESITIKSCFSDQLSYLGQLFYQTIFFFPTISHIWSNSLIKLFSFFRPTLLFGQLCY